MDEDLSELLDGALAPELVRSAYPLTQRNFLPWHLPRKHFVRINQWERLIRRQLRASKNQLRRPFKYLSLPGADLLDIRTLRHVVNSEQRDLFFLGFNSVKRGSAEEHALGISLSELLSFSGIDSASLVRRDRIESLAEPGAVSAKEFAEYAPFDAVNLDLCQSLLSTHAGTPRYLAVLERIVELQREAASRPWLLFITSRIQREQIDEATWKALSTAINRNINDGDEFRTALLRVLPPLPADYIDYGYTIQCTAAEYTKLTCISITKWLLALAFSGKPQWVVALEHCCVYAVQKGEPDLLSMACKFSRVDQAGSDITGLIQTVCHPQNQHDHIEQTAALESIVELGNMVDVDSELLADEVAYKLYKDETRELLLQAHYNIDTYDDFADRHSSRTNNARNI